MTEIYVIDTETTTTAFHDPRYNGPNGHIVEIGVAMLTVDPDHKRASMPMAICGHVFADPEASGSEWCYRVAGVPFRAGGPTPDKMDRKLAEVLKGKLVTSFNQRFDRSMLERDMPLMSNVVTWAPDIMEAADTIEEIPRKAHDTATGWRSWPSVQSTYDYLFPEDPYIEKHRALDDALLEAKILAKLFELGIYTLEGMN